MSARPPHPITRSTYAERAQHAAHPLTEYLLRLMTLKRSNLCLSADVSTTNQLLSLAAACGPSIVVFKTHYDLVSNWDYNPNTGTAARLARLAQKHGFLIFEDRKFGDIGNTVQLQYTEGTAQIIEWAHITNVNMVPGKAAVDALAEAARKWRERKRYEVKTDITVGTPRPESLDSEEEGAAGSVAGSGESHRAPVPIAGESQSHAHGVGVNHGLGLSDVQGGGGMLSQAPPDYSGRKASIVSITTVSQRYEPANSPSRNFEEFGEELGAFEGIEEPPLERGLLILAQMSSKGNFMNAEYTAACVESARENADFVMGFVSQESLNREPGDKFISMTPGCQLPPPEVDEDREVEGDGMGQQYNTPKKIVGVMGNDIVIVGRGIFRAEDPFKEAERYRAKAWEAYEERIAAK